MQDLMWMRNGFLMIAGMATMAGCSDSSGQSADDPPTKTAAALELGEPAGDFGGLEAAGLFHESNDDTAAAGQQGTRRKKFPGISFSIPKSWQEQQLSDALRMVVNSKYTIPSSGGDVELTMTTMGGGADENIQRWIGQMRLAPSESSQRDTIDIAGVTTHWVDVRGTYSSRVGEKQGPFPNWRLVGVVIPNQPKDFMFKLIGPRQAVAEIHEEFVRVVKSAKFER